MGRGMRNKLIRWLKKINYRGRWLDSGDGIKGYEEIFKRVCDSMPVKKILELGTRGGDSTRMFLKYAPEAQVVSIDINDCSTIIEDPRWTFIQADDMELPRWDPKFEGIDILLIDTSHTFSHTWEELRKFAPLVKRNGVILMHDTDPDWLMRTPVKKAINAFLKHDDPKWGIFYYSDDDNKGTALYGGLGVMRKE